MQSYIVEEYTRFKLHHRKRFTDISSAKAYINEFKRNYPAVKQAYHITFKIIKKKG